MDRETALRKIEELKSAVVSPDVILRIEETEKKKSALNSQITKIGQLKSGLGGFAADRVRELDQQISRIRESIVSLDREIENLYRQSEPIDWQLLCLDEDSGRALAISTQSVARRAFDTGGSGDWRRSSLRSWLNGKFFASLPAHVRSRVLEAPIDGARDRVFLLSVDEAKVYFGSDGQRVAKFKGEARGWWLRSPGTDQTRTACVDRSGGVSGRGGMADIDTVGVRPALWLDLDT
ncbi:MAG: DUF6273 domain-containing protein [Propionibacteriaceae bacterium]|jgi:hypothetical protein|nr:DUF6273 domain-containing protein [Propionibacteriaceae bacterium]